MQEGRVIINDIAIDDTFAEAFGMKATRLIITAHNLKWAQHSAAAWRRSLRMPVLMFASRRW